MKSLQVLDLLGRGILILSRSKRLKSTEDPERWFLLKEIPETSALKELIILFTVGHC